MIVNSQSILINKVMTEYDAAIGECLRDSVRQRERVWADDAGQIHCPCHKAITTEAGGRGHYPAGGRGGAK